MSSRTLFVCAIVAAMSIAAACGKKKESAPAAGSGAASAKGSGTASAAAGTGSASATAGTGSAADTSSSGGAGSAAGSAGTPGVEVTSMLTAAPGSSRTMVGVAATGGLGLPGAPAPTAAASADATSACQAACDHRASCGLGDAAACAPECAALFDVGTLAAADLQSYAAAACDAVKQAEPQFRVASACQHACAHRASCVDGASVKDCIPDCATLVVATGKDPADVLGGYTALDCPAVQQQEPVLTCLHGCTHVLGCGVAGDLGSCLQYCTDQLQKGLTVAQVEEISKADCEQVKQTVTLPTPASAGGSAGGGHTCTAEGIYEVCGGGVCRDHVADSERAAPTEGAAREDAMQSCDSHMAEMVAISQINDRAAVKQGCRVTGCR